MPSRLTRLARAIIRRYPQAWRDRYEVELVGFVEDSSTGWRDVLDLVRGCVVERARAFVEPEAHPNRAWILLGIARFLPALAWYGLLVLVAASLAERVPPPPEGVQWAAFVAIVPLMSFSVFWWIRANRRGPLGPIGRVPPRWSIAAWLIAFSVSYVVVFWSDPPGNPPGRIWFADWYHWYIYPLFIRQALALYSPSGLQQSARLMRVAGLRERLGWAHMELRRCETLAAELGHESLLDSAREAVGQLEGELAAAVSNLHAKVDPVAHPAESPAGVTRLPSASRARAELEWARNRLQQELSEPAAEPQVPTPRGKDLQDQVRLARAEAERLEAEVQQALADLRQRSGRR